MAKSKKVDINGPDWAALLVQQWPPCLDRSSMLELAFSGGVDSTVLLHALVLAKKVLGFRLSAVHIHHGLSRYADQWAQHCQKICEAYQVPLRIVPVTVAAKGHGIEAAARQARYEILSGSQAQAVLLAHHADDQAETYLLQALRGGGVHALSAMRPWRFLVPNLVLWRPFLALTKAILLNYAQAMSLSWVEDDTNSNLHYRRNWLRHKVMPILERALPSYRQHLQHSAQSMAEASDILSKVIEQDLSNCARYRCLKVDALTQQVLPYQKQLLLTWIKRYTLGIPTDRSLKEFLRQIQHAAFDKMPTCFLSQGYIYYYRGILWLLSNTPLLCEATNIDCVHTSNLPSWGGALSWQKGRGGLPSTLIQAGLRLALAPTHTKLHTLVGHQTCKALLQATHIPPFLRPTWPVLLDKNQACVAIPSIGVDKHYWVADGLSPTWQLHDFPDVIWGARAAI